MSRLTIFAKGNLDIRDSLHSLRIGGEVLWNGINEIVREKYPETVVRVRHETWTRSDALLSATGAVPTALSARSLALNPYPLASQFSDALFNTDADVIILSIQPDLTNQMVRHHRDGYLFLPSGWREWPTTDLCWLREEFEKADMLDVESSMTNIAAIVDRVRARSPKPILVYNFSAVVPGDTVHCHEGLEEAFTTRIRRFNLALVELSRRTGISVIDVDRIVARAGADRVKLDTLHLSEDGCSLVAHEVVRVLADIGCLPPADGE